jgi:hypothetical protein
VFRRDTFVRLSDALADHIGQMLDPLAFVATVTGQGLACTLRQAGRNLSNDDRRRLSRADPVTLHRLLTGSPELLLIGPMGGLIELAMTVGRGAADGLLDPGECGERAPQLRRVSDEQPGVPAKGSDGREALGFALRDALSPAGRLRALGIDGYAPPKLTITGARGDCVSQIANEREPCSIGRFSA